MYASENIENNIATKKTEQIFFLFQVTIMLAIWHMTHL